MCNALYALALTIYFEARSEPIYAQYAVAEVVLNRVKSDRFPNNVCDVVGQNKQFSFLWDGKQELLIKNKVAWNLAQNVAKTSLNRFPSYHGGCHYTGVEVQREWMRDLKKVAVYGNHKFFAGGC